MSEQLQLYHGDIIRHKDHPEGPEWRIKRIWAFAHHRLYSLVETSDPLRREVFLQDIETWVIKQVPLTREKVDK